MSTYTQFKGVNDWGDSTISSQIRDNLKMFIDWALLEVGAFVNVSIPTSGIYGGVFHQLRKANDPRFTDGRVWQAARKDFVWESGIEYPRKPIAISGVNVGSTFYPVGTPGSSGFVIDYPNGRVIFNSALSANSNVTLEYSYRRVQVVSADAPFFRQIQPESFRVDSTNYLLSSGQYNQLPENRVQLPTVGIEVIPRRSLHGAQLGGGHYLEQDLAFHIIANNPEDRNRLQDILSSQTDKDILFFDLNRMADLNQFPLTISGDIPASGSLSYPDLIKPTGLGGFEYKQVSFIDSEITEIGDIGPNLYGSIVITKLRLDMPDL